MKDTNTLQITQIHNDLTKSLERPEWLVSAMNTPVTSYVVTIRRRISDAEWETWTSEKRLQYHQGGLIAVFEHDASPWADKLGGWSAIVEGRRTPYCATYEKCIESVIELVKMVGVR